MALKLPTFGAIKFNKNVFLVDFSFTGENKEESIYKTYVASTTERRTQALA